ncbi:ATP-binding protein [Bradyrhizobium sp. 24]|nr:ATP-binding protein [Bradyrhizobium sp. 24]
MMLSLLVNPKKVVLIDEPEAFLHPPQIRKLADVIARETPEQTQIIVATHNDEFIRGLLDVSGDRVTVARIVRKKDDATAVSVLDSTQITNLWTDPLLRTSDVLSALFHEAAIICEGESDARFFRALIDAITTEQRRPDIRFYHFGGKDKVTSIAKALKLVSVPVVAVVDIDVLSDKAKFLALFSTMGGNAAEIEKDLTLLVSRVQSKRKDPTSIEVALELERIANELRNTSSITDQSRKQIADIGKTPSPWQRIKEDGYRGFADATLINAFQRISAASEAVGLLILKEGELEGFCRSFSRKHKSEWLASVLQLNLEEDEKLAEARSFATNLLTVVSHVIDDLPQPKASTLPGATSACSSR